MSCERIQKNIPGFLNGSLAHPEEDEVFQHLNLCVKCRFLYQDIRQNMHEASNPKPDEPPKTS